jgi:hypothetical protein
MALLHSPILICILASVTALFNSCKRPASTGSPDSATLAVENASLSDIDAAFRRGDYTGPQAAEQLANLLKQSNRNKEESKGGLGLRAGEEELSIPKMNTPQEKQVLCEAATSLAKMLETHEFYAYTAASVFYRDCPNSLCNIDLQKLNLGVIESAAGKGNVYIYDFRKTSFSIYKLRSTNIGGLWMGIGAYAGTGFMMRARTDETNTLKVFNNKVGFSLNYSMDVSNAAVLLGPIIGTVSKYLASISGINAAVGFTLGVLAKNGLPTDAETLKGKPDTYYRDGTTRFFEDILAPVSAGGENQNATRTQKVAYALQQDRKDIQKALPPHIASATGLLAAVYDSIAHDRHILDEPQNFFLLLDVQATVKLSGLVDRVRRVIQKAMSLPIGSVLLAQVRWLPVAPDDSFTMNTNSFFGLDSKALVLPKDGLGGGYLQFPTQWHMMGHMFQTGNWPALVLYLLYQEAQVVGQIANSSAKSICRQAD